MKVLKYILPAMFIGAVFASCDTDIENETITKPKEYSPQYYQNLRDFKNKNTERSISWGWLADYRLRGSMATSFLGLPDSLDICALWSGCPSELPDRGLAFYDPDIYKEMQFVRQTKGTKMVMTHIIRIRVTDFYELFLQDNIAGMEAYANFLLRSVFENDIDGLDLDYEPEGDPLSGGNLDYFVAYLGKFIGPQASPENVMELEDGFVFHGDPNKILCIDYFGTTPGPNTEPYTNWYVNQTYGSSPGRLPFGGCPTEKVVYCENVGDYWMSGCRKLLEYAAYQPATGRKGGFGAFYMHRDYVNSGYGCNNYAHMRRGIQIQNPAVH